MDQMYVIKPIPWESYKILLMLQKSQGQPPTLDVLETPANNGDSNYQPQQVSLPENHQQYHQIMYTLYKVVPEPLQMESWCKVAENKWGTGVEHPYVISPHL